MTGEPTAAAGDPGKNENKIHPQKKPGCRDREHRILNREIKYQRSDSVEYTDKTTGRNQPHGEQADEITICVQRLEKAQHLI